MRTTPLRFRLLGLAMALASGCTVIPRDTGPVGGPRTGSGVDAWPASQPRVRLAHVLGTRADLGIHTLGDWLRGNRNEPLFARPFGIAWDSSALVVADPDAGRVLRLETGERPVSSGEGVLSSPTLVTVCMEGIVVTDPVEGTVTLLDRSLRTVRTLAAGLARPTGIACIGGRVYVVETTRHRVVRLGPDGPVPVFGGRGDAPGRLNFPTALARDGTTLWVGDTLNFRVQRFDPVSGTVLASFGAAGDAPGRMPRIKGLTVDRNGHLWVTDALLDQASLYTREGVYLMSVGRPGKGPGEFAFPAGVAAAPDGRVAICDALNRRVQLFTLVEEDNG